MTGMCSQEWCTHSAHWPQIEAVNQAKAEARAYMDALARAEAAEEQLARVTAERDAIRADRDSHQRVAIRMMQERDTHIAIGQAFVDEINRISTENTALAARLEAVTAALRWYADEANYDQDEYDHENVPGEMIDSDKTCGRCRLRGCREYFEPDRGGRARAALAAGQTAPAADPARDG